MAVMPTLFMLPAVLAAAQEKVLQPLRAAGATTPERAVPLDLDDGTVRSVAQSLLRRGILVEAGAGRFYLDEAALTRRRNADWPVVFAVLTGLSAAVVLAVIALLALLD